MFLQRPLDGAVARRETGRSLPVRNLNIKIGNICSSFPWFFFRSGLESDLVLDLLRFQFCWGGTGRCGSPLQHTRLGRPSRDWSGDGSYHELESIISTDPSSLELSQNKPVNPQQPGWMVVKPRHTHSQTNTHKQKQTHTPGRFFQPGKGTINQTCVYHLLNQSVWVNCVNASWYIPDQL